MKKQHKSSNKVKTKINKNLKEEKGNNEDIKKNGFVDFILNNLFVIILAGILTTVGAAWLQRYKKIDDGFDDIITDVRKLSSLDQSAYSKCQKYVIPENNTYSKDQLSKMEAMHDQMVDRLDLSLEHLKRMGTVISLDTYKSVGAFTCLNDTILNSPKVICDIELKPPSELDHIEGKITSKLQAEKQDNRRITNAVWRISLDMFHDRMSIHHPQQPCRVKLLGKRKI